MNSERFLALIYFGLGLIMGFLSLKISTMLSLGIGVVVYLVSFFAVRQFVGGKQKLSWYVLNTLLTFILVWMVTWVFLFNL